MINSLANMAAFKSLLLLAFLEAVLAQCDYYQYVNPQVYYDIKSPGYSGSYRPYGSCRWRAETAAGYILKLTCGYFNLPQTTNCQGDRVKISPTGDTTLKDAYVFCGQRTFTFSSASNKLYMALEDQGTLNGGAFLCNITSVLATSSCNCGWKKQTRIVGGTETGVNEYPMMAGLVDVNKRIVYCGSTIINTAYVATAAHCVVRMTASDISVLVGDHDISTGSDTSASKLYSVAEIKIHPNYDITTNQNDISLVRVYGPIATSSNVLPACLPFQYAEYDFSGERVTVLGWGTTEFGGPTSNVLMKAGLSVVNRTACAAAYPGSTFRQMCTYAPGRDACQSDSGGPVLWQNPSTGRIYLVGIISSGIACATEKPGLNTRVTSYLNYILTNTPEENYCNV